MAPDTGCGSRAGTLNLSFEALPDSTSFVATVSMLASIESGGSSPDPAVIAGNALAFVDPLITLNSEWSGELVIVGGLVANAIPEPDAAWLLLGGMGLVAVRLRGKRG